jgi:Histidine kinase-, DNA gyrase B-, and HSP90-like ATPase/Replication initiator protein A
VPGRVQPLNLAATIKAALESLAPAIEAKQIDLRTWFDPGLAMISGDPSRLQQVIWNLVNNASKFTPSGGRIEIKAERVGHQVKITVTDTGQGIAPELLPHLFERFQQGDISTKRSSGGLGLGLAIVKHIVEMHGGIVSAASAGPGHGATFTVLLPITASMEESVPAPANSDAGHLAEIARLENARVLIVDDDTDTCAVMARILRQTGAIVTTATNAESALARKHCGNQAKWTISTKLLHKKSGSRATIVKFREMLKRTAMDDCLPDYRVTYDTETDQAMFLIRGHDEAEDALGS